MKSLNILDLQKTVRMRQIRRLESFDKIVEMCHKKIISQTSIGNVRCFFMVPEYMVGLPLYQLNQCIDYVIKKLSTNGFIVKHLHSNVIYISWDVNEMRVGRRQVQAIQSSQNANQPDSVKVKYKPSGKLTLTL